MRNGFRRHTKEEHHAAAIVSEDVMFLVGVSMRVRLAQRSKWGSLECWG